MELKRRDFLKVTAALATASVPPSLLVAGKKQFTTYDTPAMPSVAIAIMALQDELTRQTNVSLKVWHPPGQPHAGVANEQFKVMMDPSNVSVSLRNQGQKVGMVNILTSSITQLVCKGSVIVSPQDLVGKRILVPFKNDTSGIMPQALLRKLKTDVHKTGVIYTATPSEAVGLFSSRDYHAATLPEPMAGASILKGKTMGINVVCGFGLVKVWGQAPDIKPLVPMTDIIANEGYLHAHKVQFDIFHQDLEDALNWILANRQNAAKIGKNYLPTPGPTLVIGLGGA